jgi:hypothetical protein
MLPLKLVYLLIYSVTSINNGGGPTMQILQMPSKSVCEQVGAAAKNLAENYTYYSTNRNWTSPKLSYWCIETN